MAHPYPEKQQYQLTQAEQRFVNILRRTQQTAVSTRTPRTLMVVVTDKTMSFYDGQPSGVNKIDKQE